MKWKESKDAVFFNVERSFVGKKFWRSRAPIFLRINEELTKNNVEVEEIDRSRSLNGN